MVRARHSGSVSVEDEIGLTKRIQTELELLMFNKERYDMDYPDNKKDLALGELRPVAREKVIQELCVPPCSTEDRTT